jgi:uncharacterized protein (DUF1499 family)
VISFFTLLGLFLSAVGFTGAYFHFLSPIFGFYLALAGAAIMAVMMIPQFISLFRKYTETSWAGLLLGLAAAGALGFMIRQAMNSPLNDLTTNVSDPPRFLNVSAEIPVDDPSLLEEEFLVLKAYDVKQAELQAKHFPGLAPLALPIPADQAFARVDQVIRTQFPLWKIVKSMPGHIEAEIRSSGFRFVDDLVVQVRAEGKGSRIDIRSRSRMGKSDLGVNAARIEDLKVRLQKGTP